MAQNHKKEVRPTTKEHKSVSDKKFDKLLKNFLVEKASMLKRLSKK